MDKDYQTVKKLNKRLKRARHFDSPHFIHLCNLAGITKDYIFSPEEMYAPSIERLKGYARFTVNGISADLALNQFDFVEEVFDKKYYFPV